MCVEEDWAAVAAAISERVQEFGWPQGELAERSQVSRATVHEIQHHTVERRRSTRTLEALSIALSWHPQHLEALLHGRRPPNHTTRDTDNAESLYSRVHAIEHRLGEITDRLDEIGADLKIVVEHVRNSE